METKYLIYTTPINDISSICRPIEIIVIIKVKLNVSPLHVDTNKNTSTGSQVLEISLIGNVLRCHLGYFATTGWVIAYLIEHPNGLFRLFINIRYFVENMSSTLCQKVFWQWQCWSKTVYVVDAKNLSYLRMMGLFSHLLTPLVTPHIFAV